MPIEFNLSFEDRDFFKNLEEKVLEVTKLAIKYTALEVWGNIKKEAPVDHGRLAGSFMIEQQNDLAWKIYTNVKYALAVHEGTGIYGPEKKPIEIRPVNKKALFWEGAKHPVKRVLHPGQKPNPYVERAIENTRKRVDEFIQRAINETLGGGGK